MPTRSQKKTKEPTPWELSKPILTKDILEGTVNATMDYKAGQKLKRSIKPSQRQGLRTI
jgi:hypothetical protein